jgi:hypothetical protein
MPYENRFERRTSGSDRFKKVIECRSIGSDDMYRDVGFQPVYELAVHRENDLLGGGLVLQNKLAEVPVMLGQDGT